MVGDSLAELVRDILSVGLPVALNVLIVWAVVRTYRRRKAERDALDP